MQQTAPGHFKAACQKKFLQGLLLCLLLLCQQVVYAQVIDTTFAPKELESKDLVVTFSPGSGKYAFDEWDERYENISLINNKNLYERLGSYRVPCKLVPPGKTDRVGYELNIVNTKMTFHRSRLMFKTGAGVILQQDSLSGEVIIPGGKANDAQELYVLYPDAQGEYRAVGKLKVLSYPLKSFKVKLVPLRSGGQSYSIDPAAVQSKLDEVYGPLGITWEVTQDSPFDYSSADLISEGSDLLSTYSDEMKTLNSAYRQSREIDKQTVYLFVMNRGEIKGMDIAGDMPRGKQFGYLFTGNSGDLPWTAAHELGHGRFQLRHTFDSEYGGALPLNSTRNLMDYAGGIHLAKWQWDEIFSPAILVSPFEGDEDGMSQQNWHVVSINKMLELSTHIAGEDFHYITPDGRIITLEKAIRPSFTGVTGVKAIDDKIAKGCLLGFAVGDKQYVAVYNGANSFLGYFPAGSSQNKLDYYKPKTLNTSPQAQMVIVGIEQDDCNMQIKTFSYPANGYDPKQTIPNTISRTICPPDAPLKATITIPDCHNTAKGKEVIAYLNANGYQAYPDLVNKIGSLVSKNKDEKYDDYRKISSETKPSTNKSREELEKYYTALEQYYKNHENAKKLTDPNCQDCPVYPIEGDGYWDEAGRNWCIKDGKWFDLSGEFTGNAVWKSGIDVQKSHLEYYQYKLSMYDTPLQKQLGYTDKSLFEREIWRSTQFAMVHILKEEWISDQLGATQWIPVFGSIKKAYYNDLVGGSNVQTAVDLCFGSSDVFLVKALTGGIYKLSLWAGKKLSEKEVCYFVKKQLLTSQLSFRLSASAPKEATSLFTRQTDNIIEIVNKVDNRFIRYDLQTGEALICDYSDNTLQLTYKDFQTFSIKSTTADDIAEEVLESVGKGGGGRVLITEGLETLNGVKAFRMSKGTNPNKVIIIGRNMDDVRLYKQGLEAQGMKVEIFDGDIIPQSAINDWANQTVRGTKRLTEPEVIATEMYKANKEWIEKIIKEGYNIYDIGNLRAVAGDGLMPGWYSVFYEMERTIIFP